MNNNDISFDVFPSVLMTQLTDEVEAKVYNFFKESQILSLHLPLTVETDKFVNKAFFEKFAKPIIFINTSRGEIAPLNDILQALNTGIISMAALDVLECEKFSKMTDEQTITFKRIKDSGKVLFTPHVAGWTHESYRRINVVLVEKIGAFLDRG